MKQLLEDYQRRLRTLNEELKITIDEATDLATITRLTIKRGCYRTFISELERLVPKTKEKELSLAEARELVRKEKAEFEVWKIENDKRNAEFIRQQDEIEKAGNPPKEYDI